MTSTAWAGSMAGSGARSSRSALTSVIDAGGAVDPGPLGDDPIELASHELEALIGEERQAVALHPNVVGVQGADDERLLPQWRLRHDRSVGGQDPRAAPEREALLVPDAIAERERHRPEQRVRVLHLVPPLDRLEPGAGAGSPRRPRGHVDEQVGAVEGLEHRQAGVPEVLADGQTDAPDGGPGSMRPHAVARAGEAALVEEAVGGQVHLAMEADELAITHEGRAVRVSMVVGLLDEPDRHEHAAHAVADAEEAGIVALQRDLGHEILEQVAAQRELR